MPAYRFATVAALAADLEARFPHTPIHVHAAPETPDLPATGRAAPCPVRRLRITGGAAVRAGHPDAGDCAHLDREGASGVTISWIDGPTTMRVIDALLEFVDDLEGRDQDGGAEELHDPLSGITVHRRVHLRSLVQSLCEAKIRNGHVVARHDRMAANPAFQSLAVPDLLWPTSPAHATPTEGPGEGPTEGPGVTYGGDTPPGQISDGARELASAFLAATGRSEAGWLSRRSEPERSAPAIAVDLDTWSAALHAAQI